MPIAQYSDRASAWAKSNVAVSVKLDAAWDANRKLYGARKIWHVLRRQGEDIAHPLGRFAAQIACRVTEPEIDLSVGTVGDAYDNALIECIIHSGATVPLKCSKPR